MRVAVVTELTVHREDSLGTRRIRRTAQALAERGHDVTIFCTQWWEGYAIRFERDGLTYQGVTTGLAPWSFATRIPFLLAHHRPDAVLARPVPPGSVIAAGTGAALAGASFVVDWYGDEDYPNSQRGRRALAVPDRTLAPSDLVLSRLRDGGLDGETAVVPEPIAFDRIRATTPAEPVDVVYGGSLDGDANLESLLLALADITEPLQTVVIGDGPERSSYETQAADLGLENVAFVGDCSREERIARYRGAHVFVHTAEWAPFARELCWGLACGCVGVVELQAESAGHELVRGHERGLLATDAEGVTDCIREARGFPRRDIDEEFADYDEAAVIDRYLTALGG